MENLEEEIRKLRQVIQKKNDEIEQYKTQIEVERRPAMNAVVNVDKCSDDCEQQSGKDIITSLSNDSIARYSRQLILPEIGVHGQIALSNTSVLIVGAGGLGCPAAIYLSAAGIGTLGLVDYDEVEISNLHRQILHRETRVGVCKSMSAVTSCQQLNSSVRFIPYHLQLDSANALQIIKQYDMVLDATDNVATRYLLNDACVLAGKPLVSGSALRFEGQLTVYNHKDGPCYRCLYPKPPPPETVTNCSDGGVLGVVPGIIGSLQALEAIKIAAGIGTSYSQKMLLFDGLDGCFKTIRLRGRQASCPVCGTSPSITQLIDYEQFCGARASDKDKTVQLLEEEERISVKEYKAVLDEGRPHVLVDVRQPVELEICQLPHSNINIPPDSLNKSEFIERLCTELNSLSNTSSEQKVPVFVVCRKGNDSQLAVRKLKEKLKDIPVDVRDISGGMAAWSKQIDANFPTY